jgi:hypothetical protein
MIIHHDNHPSAHIPILFTAISSPLQALFSVMGTPCWADVAAVQEPSWRRYLHHLPGRAPTLYRRCGAGQCCELRRYNPPRGLP